MIETWDDLLRLLRLNEVPGTTLTGDTRRRLDEITEAARGPAGMEPHVTITVVLESRMRTLGVELPVNIEDLAFGEIAFFLRDFFPYETIDAEGRILAIVHDATRTVRIGGSPYPIVWSGNQAVVTLPREVLQAPPEADIPLWLRQAGCEIRFGKRALGIVRYDRVPRPDEALERAVASLEQPRWRDLPHDWRRLAQPVTWTNDAGEQGRRWCLPVAPITSSVATDDFAVCESQQAALNGARRLLASGLARQARTAPERELSEQILRLMPAWEDLTDDIVYSLPAQAAALAHQQSQAAPRHLRKLIVCNMVSLDGYYAVPANSPMSTPLDGAFDDYCAERLRTADTLLLGRVSYDWFQRCWPPVDDTASPTWTPVRRELARLAGAVAKVVVSDGMATAPTGPWQYSRVIKWAQAHEQIAALRRQSGNDVVILGSRMLWNDLLAHGLVDELQLLIRPLVLGGGMPLFVGQPGVPLRLIDTRRWDDSDTVLVRYSTGVP